MIQFVCRSSSSSSSKNLCKNAVFRFWVVLILIQSCLFYIQAQSLPLRNRSINRRAMPFVAESHKIEGDINGKNLDWLVGDGKRSIRNGPNPLHNK